MRIKPIPIGYCRPFATFSKEQALRLATLLKKRYWSGCYFERLVLYGGGSFGKMWIVRLCDVRPGPVYYYGRNNEPDPGWQKDIWKVSVTLESVNDEPLPGGKQYFTPSLGSWRLGVLEKESK